MAAILSADGVVKRFGAVTALGGVTVDVTEGITGLLGANGAGKTTLLGLSLGLTHPDGGRLEVLGLDPVAAGPDVRAIVGYSPEHQSLPPEVQAYDLVAHLAEVHGLPHRAATDPGQRRPLPGRPGRGALPAGGHDVDRTEAAGEAGRRPGPRPVAHPARRAHRRPRPGPARRHAHADPAGRHRVRHQRAPVVAPPRRGRAGVRQRRHPGRRPGGGGRPPRRAAHRRRWVVRRGRGGHRRAGRRAAAGRGRRSRPRAGASSWRTSSRPPWCATRSPPSASALVRLERRRLTLEDVFLEAGVYG